MKILNINGQGMSDPGKRRRLFKLVQECGSDLTIVTEIKNKFNAPSPRWTVECAKMEGSGRVAIITKRDSKIGVEEVLFSDEYSVGVHARVNGDRV